MLNIIDHSSELKDFADTAGLIAEMDMVIAVDTAVAHLAGATGKPVWVLLHTGETARTPEWRWLLIPKGIPAWGYPHKRVLEEIWFEETDVEIVASRMGLEVEEIWALYDEAVDMLDIEPTNTNQKKKRQRE
jgi:hypothetical protein